MRAIKIKNSWLEESDLRLDSPFHLSEGVVTKRLLDKFCPYTITDLKNEVSELFKGDIHKRVYVSPGNGSLEFYSASDLLKTSILNPKHVSKKYSPHLETLKLHPGWILISRSGTLGNILLTNKTHEGIIGTDDLVRLKPKENQILKGVLYAYLASKYGYGLLTQSGYGGVVKHIEPHHIENLPIPIFPNDLQKTIDDLISKSSNLREKAKGELISATNQVLNQTSLPEIDYSEFEHFGNHKADRRPTSFVRKRSEITSFTINAFNYSKKVERLENRVRQSIFLELQDCLDENKFFSSGSFKRFELESPNSIRLINQSDIFNLRKQGKMLAKIYVKSDKLVEYGEVLIAGVGTLGEGETFCRTIFANEELEGQLISGEFIRMKTNSKVPSGYLYAWLSSDYGFRFIRKTQSGTKLCRPIHELLKNIPVPIIEKEEMLKIDEQVKKAYTMLFEALNAENKAIELVEREIESWQKS
ncbi:methylation-associated defense system restriction endonuclease subunit S MAD5 [Algoriphagus confluentis]|uniref:Restriction endonuclease subunit S n=1 Tax=Algoriphagus confluentis TaxID=1697556 RepID=A0ABQ6PJE5_9BACT|nr:restriction endonuclease subunit S [Algoriphagus confluentis]